MTEVLKFELDQPGECDCAEVHQAIVDEKVCLRPEKWFQVCVLLLHDVSETLPLFIIRLLLSLLLEGQVVLEPLILVKAIIMQLQPLERIIVSKLVEEEQIGAPGDQCFGTRIHPD